MKDNANYKSAYLKLFNAVTDIIRSLEQAQILCEDILIGDDNAEPEEKSSQEV